MHEALIVLWGGSGRGCGKRVRPLLPVLVGAMERHGHLRLAPEVRTGVLAMSAGDDRSGAAGGERSCRGQETPAHAIIGGGAAERAGANVRGLAGSGSRVRRGGPGGA